VNKSNHLPAIFENIKTDVSAGLVVFFVALPLCLGIALASGAPLFSGVMSGIVGGLLVSFFSRSQLSVSGPAAGLTVICADAIKELGSFEGLLVSIIIAGIFQIVFGILRLGYVGEYFPSSVIKGMLAGIGCVIILKQIPHALGRDADYPGDIGFWQFAGDNSLTAIIQAVQTFNPLAVLISGCSLLILFLWDSPKIKSLKYLAVIPGPVIVVVFGSFVAQFVPTFADYLTLSRASQHFVDLPHFDSLFDFLQKIPTPDFKYIFDPKIYKVAITLAVIASLESLLSVEATDKLDPYKRITPTNRELIAQGLGNITSGMLGGLPLTAVILRSSANIYAGGKTRLASITHGLFLLVAVFTIPFYLNLIPLSCLAAILIVIGYKLAKISLFKEMYHAGFDQFLPFIATIIAILFTDLLTGVSLGLFIGILTVIATNRHDALTIVNDGEDYLIRFNKDISFLNKAELKEGLATIPDGANLMIDGTRSMYIDKDIYDILNDFKEQCSFRGIVLELKNISKKSLPFNLKRKRKAQ
jgi:MFS superfamily sulfate permease-like transporter